MLRARACIRSISEALNDPLREADGLRINVGESSKILEGSLQPLSEYMPQILVTRINGQVYAVGNRCPHLGAPLHTGQLSRFRITCSSHLSEFDVRTGELLGGPALMSLPTFPAFENDGQVFVDVPKESIQAEPINSSLYVKRNPSNHKHFVVLGGGAAAQSAVETLRRAGYEGRLTMITKEGVLPYDRTLLSKFGKLSVDDMLLRPKSFYDDFGVEVQLNTKIARIDELDNVAVADNGNAFKFDKLLVATGCKPWVPMHLRKAYAKLKNVFPIREAAEYFEAQQCLKKSSRVVIVGDRLEAFELARSIRESWILKDVTLLVSSDQTFIDEYGFDITKYLVEITLYSGVNLVPNGPLDKIVQNGNRAVAVKFGGNVYETDCLFLATGYQVQTEFMPDGLTLADKTVIVNSSMQALHPHIYAAGDIVSFPNAITQSRERCDGWKTARDQGMCAALNMLGKGKPFISAPFHWANAELSLQFVGFRNGSDSKVSYTLEPLIKNIKRFCTIFYKAERPIGVVTVNISNAAVIFKSALERNLLPTKENSHKFNLDELVEKVEAGNTCWCSVSL